MLERLFIKQFAIIEEMAVEFTAPFTVLTGETGAGKSIVIDAVTLLLGGRAMSEMIRHGSEKAYVEGEFSLEPGGEAMEQLLEEGLAEAGDDSLILSREIGLSGKNSCRINGKAVTLSRYKSLAAGLIDIQGQHDYQQLMQTHRQLSIADAFGGADLAAKKEETGGCFLRWQELMKKLADAKSRQAEILAKKDFLLFQINEIDQAQLRPGEEEELAAEIQKLSHRERIVKNLDKGYMLLFNSGDGVSAYDLLAKALNQLRDLSRYDPELGGLYDRLEPASYLLDEAAREIAHYKDNLDMQPGRLEQAENRQYKIRMLCQKYGDGTAAVLEKRRQLGQELSEMENYEILEEEWKKEIQKSEKQYYTAARELHEKRLAVKRELEERINREIRDLAMPAAQFIVDLQETVPWAGGMDAVEFLISTNAGEPFLPLAKIASGGELSRITLAMKRVLAAMDSSQALVFDEIDSGMGGVTAYAVADKLEAISESQQVICITHSAAIAARAKQHLYLEKQEEGGRTKTTVQDLQRPERIAELARMLGGSAGSEDLMRHAARLLDRQN
ncbi:MAG: DNA repair protein RecN [Peptococcaceae bacterium]|nr:DNA repair protein RecN [Peptococcaceae bacterium]